MGNKDIYIFILIQLSEMHGAGRVNFTISAFISCSDINALQNFSLKIQTKFNTLT